MVALPSWLSKLVGGNLGALKTVADRVAHLEGLAHALRSVRDEDAYAGVRADCAKRIGCTPERFKEVCTAISDAAAAGVVG